MIKKSLTVLLLLSTLSCCILTVDGFELKEVMGEWWRQGGTSEIAYNFDKYSYKISDDGSQFFGYQQGLYKGQRRPLVVIDVLKHSDSTPSNEYENILAYSSLPVQNPRITAFIDTDSSNYLIQKVLVGEDQKVEWVILTRERGVSTQEYEEYIKKATEVSGIDRSLFQRKH